MKPILLITLLFFSLSLYAADPDVRTRNGKVYIEGKNTSLVRKKSGNQYWTTGTRKGKQVDEMSPSSIQKAKDRDAGIYWKTKDTYKN